MTKKPAMTKKAAAAPPAHPQEAAAPGPGDAPRKGTGPPLRPQGCCASLKRRLPVPQVRGAGLDPGDLCGPSGRKSGQAPACPARRRGASGEPGAHATDDPSQR